MILIIGSKNCNRCLITKDILDKKGVEYNYSLINELPEEEQDKYMDIAKECNMLWFPIIIKDSKAITLQEAEKCI